MSVTFFDLDRTLLSVNSGTLWIREELAQGRIRKREALEAGFVLGLYRLGLSSISVALEKAIASLAGSPAEEMRQRTRRFFETHVRPYYRPGAIAALDRHRAAGELPVLLTSSSFYLAERVGEDLGIEHILSNRFEIDGAGLHTGRCVGGLCFGDGKVHHAEAFLEERGVRLSECTFYTDSYSDLPLLACVGRPVAVNPDRRLEREARRRRWSIVDWGAPTAR